MRLLTVLMGFICGLVIAFGRHLFGFGGSTTPWYALGISLPYLLLSIALGSQIKRLTKTGSRPKRAILVWTVLSWVTAFGFALTAPDHQPDGTLAALIAPPGSDQFVLDMAVAFCNPFAILCFGFLIGAIIIAALQIRNVVKQDSAEIA